MKKIGFPVKQLEIIDSTNNYANHQLAEGVVTEGTVFLAEYQTSGKGQQYNSWESEKGKNLTFSLVLSPSFVEIIDQFVISKVVTLGMTDFLIRSGFDGVSIKWPNDLYVGNRKIAGILIENAIMGSVIASSVIGVGLNVNQEKFLSSAPNPVSMKMLTGKDYNLNETLSGLMKGIENWYAILDAGKVEIINAAYEQRMYRRNLWSQYRKENGDSFEGKIQGVNEIGQLLIEDRQSHLSAFHFKEVAFIL